MPTSALIGRGGRGRPGRGPVSGDVTLVNSGADLQAAIDAAVPGDTLALQAGAVWTGQYFLPDKVGTGYVTITTQGTVPAIGEMRSAAYRSTFLAAAAAFPVIRTVSSAPCLQSYWGARHYKFIAVDIRSDVSVLSNETFNIVLLGTRGINGNEDAAATLADLPHHIEFDRCYVHGHPTGNTRRGICGNANDVRVENCYFTDIHVEFNGDTQCFGAWNGAGPFFIDNNCLEAAGENVMFGGSDSPITNMIPSDVTFTRNYLAKKLSWWSLHGTFAGIAWQTKSLMELKNCQRCLIEHNVFENMYPAIFTQALIMRPANISGINPWAQIKDITVRNNLFRHIADGVALGGREDLAGSPISDNVQVTNNLFDDLGFGYPASEPGGALLLSTHGPSNTLVDHNTVWCGANLNEGAIVNFGVLPQGVNMIIRNNMLQYKRYGIFGSGAGGGTNALTTYYSSYTVEKNVIATDDSELPQYYPPNQFWPTYAAYAAAFTDQPNGDYTLAPGSPYIGAGTDSEDIGVDMSLIPNF